MAETPKIAKVKSAGASNIAKAAAAPRVAPVLTAISAAVAIPDRPARNGRTVYPFDMLSKGQSFGVANKTAKQLASIVSAANKRNRRPKRDTANNIIFKMKKNDAGVLVTTNEPETVFDKYFIVLDVDPKSDPDKATARVWRRD